MGKLAGSHETQEGLGGTADGIQIWSPGKFNSNANSLLDLPQVRFLCLSFPFPAT